MKYRRRSKATFQYVTLCKLSLSFSLLTIFLNLFSVFLFFCYRKWRSDCSLLKCQSRGKVVERKVSFILDASKKRRWSDCPKAKCPLTH